MNIKNKEVSMSKLQLSPNKVACLQKLSNENGIISALAFDPVSYTHLDVYKRQLL